MAQQVNTPSAEMHGDGVIITPSSQPLRLLRDHVPSLNVFGALAQMTTDKYELLVEQRYNDLIISLADCMRKVSSLIQSATDPVRSTKVCQQHSDVIALTTHFGLYSRIGLINDSRT